MKQSTKLSTEQTKRMIELHNQHWSSRQIADELGVSTHIIWLNLNREGLIIPRKQAPAYAHSDYYLDILEWGLPPFEISLLDDRISRTAIGVLRDQGLIRPTDGRIRGRNMYETSPRGIETLKAAGRSTESLRESAGG